MPEKELVRMTTQILLGIMLAFGTLTLLPKSVLLYRFGRTGKAVLYFFLSPIIDKIVCKSRPK